MRLYCYQFSWQYAGDSVGDLHPSQIELLPSLESLTRSHEDIQPASDLSPGEVVNKTPGRSSNRAVCQRWQLWARERSALSGREELLLFLLIHFG